MKSTSLLLILFCVGCCTRYAEGARILGLFPFHAKSHFGMFKEIMKSLADAGHRVDVVGHFPLEAPHANYTDIIDLGGTLPMVVNNISYEFIEQINKISLARIIQMAGTEVCELLELPDMQKLIKKTPTDLPYDLVITEMLMASCYLAFGRYLKVPVVGLSSLPTAIHANEALGNPLNPAIVSEIMERPVSHMNFWQRLKNTIYIFAAILQIKYYTRVQNDIVKKNFGPEMPDVRQLEREISLNLVNSHYIFHGVRPLTPAIVEVAGIHVYDDETPLPPNLKKWLDDSKSGFIYFSFGSLIKIESFPKSTIAELYEAFARIAPLRVVMKAAYPDELPPGIPDNVLTLKWAPQVKILKHTNIRGFLTHGGLMGLQEAVTFGVPLIGVPFFVDQMGNVHACVERGIAVSMNYKDLTANKIVSAINAVVYNPKYKDNMNAISKQFLDRPMNARDTSVFWIEYILRNGGDSLRSPAVQLTWWQLALLDVYGCIIAAVLLVIYTVKLILSTLFRRTFQSTGKLLTSKKRN